MHRRRFWVGALVVASGLGMAGCGDASRTETTDDEPVIEDPSQPEIPADPEQPGDLEPFPDDIDDPPTDPVVVTPTPAPAGGWTFYGAAEGAPVEVLGVTADAAGNVWVAGGTEGLFLLKPGATSFRKFTMADGLRPYGYMADGSTPPGDPFLKVISVSGGPAGTVFVGYQGKKAAGKYPCENEWDESANPDPSVYKSGDADRVMLNGDAISVVHYDISSGPGVVRDELRGREKLCDVARITYDPVSTSVWFGANHGFARGDANFAGDPVCNGQLACSGVLEHVHPFLESGALETGYYRGFAPDGTGDVWVGGDVRSTKFKYAALGFWSAQGDSESKSSPNKIDFWPDENGVKKTDGITAMSVAQDGTIWASSLAFGVARLNSDGAIIGRMDKNSGLQNNNVSALHADPVDGTVWIGYEYVGGLSRIGSGGGVDNYGIPVFGEPIVKMRVSDIQADRSSPSRRLLVSFTDLDPADGRATGVVGIYTGG